MALTHRDRYGGCPDIHFEATGFFRLEKTDRWWLVTPDGNAFLSLGLNHVEPGLLMADYNRQHWAKQFGIDPNSDMKAFLPGFQAKARADLAALGMNTLGCHSPTHHYPEMFVPYVAQFRCVDICHYMRPTEEDFHDVFSDEFVGHCDQMAREKVAPKKDDPLIIGCSMTDCPVLTDLEALPRDSNIYGSQRRGLPTWPRVLRNLGESSPGKRAYVACMRRIYRDDIRDFNGTYNTAFRSFDELQRAANWRRVAEYNNSRECRDNREFLIDVVDRCYEVEVAALRRHDPNHLVLGDKFNGNMDVPDEIIALHGKHFDLIFFQFYANWCDLEALLNRFEQITGKALFHGDSCYAAVKENMPDPYGPQCANQEVRAQHFEESFYNAFARKDFVGWNWCGWLEYWQSYRPGKQHSGVQDPFGNFDEPLATAMKEFSERMYDVAIGEASCARPESPGSAASWDSAREPSAPSVPPLP